MTNLYFDKYGFLLNKRNAVDEGKGDAIGTMALLYLCTSEPNYLEPLKWVMRITCNRFYLIRHPDIKEDNISREHTIYWQLAMKKAIDNNDPEAKILVEQFLVGRKWKVSEKFNRTLDMWLWETVFWRRQWKDIPKKKYLGWKIWTYLFFFVSIPQYFFLSLWNKLIRRIYKLSDFEYLRMDRIKNFPFSHYWNPKSKLLYPAYARHLDAWKWQFLPESFLKKLLQKISLSMDVGNPVVRALLGDKRLAYYISISNKPDKGINFLFPLTGYRWSAEVNINCCDRYFEENVDKIQLDLIVFDYVLHFNL